MAESQQNPTTEGAKDGGGQNGIKTNGNGAGSARSESKSGESAAQARQPGTASAAATAKRSASGEDAVAMLKADHRKVEELFASFEKARTKAQKQKIVTQVCTELKIHAELEEKIFYPAVREEAEAEDKLDEAQVEHDTLKILIANLESGDPREQFYEAMVTVLKEYVNHHVKEEEAPDGILAMGRKAGLDLGQIGQQMQQRKQELQENPEAIRAQPVSLGRAGGRGAGQTERLGNQATMQKENDMPRTSGSRSSGQGRDDQGRFMGGRGYNDDDYDRSRRSRSRDDDDDDRGGRSGSRSSRSRDDDDDRGGRSSGGRGGNGGRGGWFGDSEGHSEAARRGWDDRDDDRGGRSSRSSRSRDDDDRGHGGWFGDSRGHSEAARRGWESRH